MSSVLLQERLTLLNVLRRTTLMQSMIQFMRWLVTRQDTEEPLRDFLTDILVNYKIDKYHLKMQRKNQFVKMSFYELVLFWSCSNKHLFVLHFYHTFCRFHSAQDSETYSLCLHLIHHRFNTGKGTNIHQTVMMKISYTDLPFRGILSSVYIRFLYIHRHIWGNTYNSIFYN